MVSLGVVYPVGAVIQGRLGDAFGLREIAVGAAVLFIAVVAFTLGTRAERRAVLQEAPPRAIPQDVTVPTALA
jgi:MFS family permease